MATETAREHTVAELRLARGDPDAAYTTARDAYADPDNGKLWRLMSLLHAAAQAAAGRINADETDWIATAAQDQVALWPHARWWAMIIDATLHPDPDRWRKAADALVPGQTPVYLRMTTYLTAARAMVGAGNRADAADLLAQAAELAARHGARTVLADAEQLAQHARLRLPGQPRQSGPDAGAPDADGLTSREFEVLRLVAVGRSNPQIAAELFISPKTASVHLSRILAKLQVTSRGESAAAAWARGLLPRWRRTGSSAARRRTSPRRPRRARPPPADSDAARRARPPAGPAAGSASVLRAA